MAGPPSTLRTHASSTPEDPNQVSIHDSVSPSLQQLIRLQIFTPLTILLALGANLVTVFVFHPNLGEISDHFETIWTPKKSLIGGYLLLMYVLQIGYCLLITMSRSPATKEMVVSGVGLRFCIVNVLQAAWSILFLLKQFLAASIVLIVAAFLMLTVWMTLLRYPTSTNQPFSHPAKWLFIHVPVRMLLLFYINLAIWQNGLIAMHWYRYHGTDADAPKHHGKWEPEHETHAWIAFGVITGLGLIDAFIVFLGKDLAWAACTIFIFISILLHENKPVQVVVPLIMVCSLQIVALVAAYTWQLYVNRRKGAIRLEEDEVEEDASIVHA